MALLAACAYLNALPNEFVGYDDHMLVLENPAVQEGRVRQILTQPIKGTYLPVRALSYAAEYQLYRGRAAGYHLTNLLLHGANSVLVVLVLHALGMGLGVACAAGGLFALHAVHTEAVTWIAGRRDVLAALFFLLAFWSYIRFARSGSRVGYWAGACAYVLACLSKGVAVTFLPVVVAWDWGTGRIRASGPGRYFRGLLPLVVITAAMLAVHVSMGQRSGAIRGYHGGSFPAAMHAMSGVLASYARLLLAPVQLCANYARGPAWQPSPAEAGAGVALVLAGAVWALVRRRPGFWFWWALLNLLPVLHLVPLSTLQAERYLYLPSVSVCVLLAWCTFRVRRRRQWAAAALCVMLACHAALTCRRNGDWSNAASLWRSVVRVNPANGKAVGSLALLAQGRGQWRRAEAGYHKAIRLDPRLPRTHMNLGSLYALRGRDDLAEPAYRHALSLREDLVKAHVNLGLLLCRTGRAAAAAAHMRRCRELEPQSPAVKQLEAQLRSARPGAGGAR